MNLISVIIPTYNRYVYIGETLDSLINQTYRNWECIIIDDGSGDYTSELLDFYTEVDNRIKWFKRPEKHPKGANVCRNLGFEKSKGEIIQFLDSDDIISTDKFESQIHLLEKQSADLVFCKWGRFSENGDSKVFEALPVYQNFNSSLRFLNVLADSIGYLPNHSYLIKRNLVHKAGNWLDGLTINQDGEFMIRVISRSDKICYSKKGVAYYRWKMGDNNSETLSENVDDLINSWKLIEAYLILRYKEKDLYFMNRVKDRLYLGCKSLPGVIKEHNVFFKRQICLEPYKFTSWIHHHLVKFKVGRSFLKPFKRIRKKIYG